MTKCNMAQFTKSHLENPFIPVVCEQAPSGTSLGEDQRGEGK